MGGFAIRGPNAEDLESYRVLLPKNLYDTSLATTTSPQAPPSVPRKKTDIPGKITPTSREITAKIILDKSKGDSLTKGFVVIQTTWFVLQCIARGVKHLPITELEVVTLAFAALNLVTFAFWWNKPLNVRCPIIVDGEDGDEEVRVQGERAGENNDKHIEPKGGGEHGTYLHATPGAYPMVKDRPRFFGLVANIIPVQSRRINPLGSWAFVVEVIDVLNKDIIEKLLPPIFAGPLAELTDNGAGLALRNMSPGNQSVSPLHAGQITEREA